MRIIIILSTSLIAVICGIWFARSPGYDSLIVLITSLTALITELIIPMWHKYIGENIYSLSVRAINEKELMKRLKKIFKQIKKYKTDKIDGEFSHITLHARKPINHKDLYDAACTIRDEIGGKIYSVKGKRKAYGLIDDGGPAIYF